MATRYRVLCTKRGSTDAITHIGYEDSDGNMVHLPKSIAIQDIENKDMDMEFYVLVDKKEVTVIVSGPANNRDLTTTADTTTKNNLRELPLCT